MRGVLEIILQGGRGHSIKSTYLGVIRTHDIPKNHVSPYVYTRRLMALIRPGRFPPNRLAGPRLLAARPCASVKVKLETTPVSDSRIDLKFVRTEIKVRVKNYRSVKRNHTEKGRRDES